MSTHPAPAERESLAALHEQDVRELRALLLGLARQGAELAALYVEQAKDQAYDAKPGAGPSPACATSYCEVARSIRQTAMLVQKLTDPAPVAKTMRAEPDKVAIRRRIIRQVEDNIYRDAPAGESERLHAEFLERLERPEFDDELGRRPDQDIINEIRGDLAIRGLDSLDHFKRRTPADIAVLCARAAGLRGTTIAPTQPHSWQGAAPIRGP